MSDSWPIEHNKELLRPELEVVKSLGYVWEDPRDVITIFEKKIAEFAGSNYAVTVDCCSHGLFLALKYQKAYGVVEIPSHTYQSVPMQIIHAGCTPSFRNEKWEGVYQLKPYPIYDAAVRWTKGMYQGGLSVVSFQIKKRIPIGRGGAILTDDKAAYDWLTKARYDGRDLNKYTQWEDPCELIGWHYYMTPEDAARGIILMDNTPLVNKDSASWVNYANLESKFR